MLKRELKVNFKSFIVWLILIIAIFAVVFLIYPSITNSANIKKIDEMIKIFPKEILAAFNMDISSLNNAFGWLKSEGFVFILLLTSCYAGILGTNILLKEENDKTIEYLNSLPTTRTKIVLTKTLTGLIYVMSLIISIGVFNYIALTLSGEFNQKQFLLLSITPLFPSLLIYFICLFISTFVRKTKRMIGVSLSIVFVSYILYMLSTIAKEIEFIKYVSVFTLADIRNVIQDTTINPIMPGITVTLSIILFIITILRYNKKEFI